MNRKIREFKEYIESVAKNNFSDYDAVEYLDGFSYTDYNSAVDKINNCSNTYEMPNVYKELFTNDEMLKVGIMYACIVTGAIESNMTKELNDSWKKFESEQETRSFSYY